MKGGASGVLQLCLRLSASNSITSGVSWGNNHGGLHIVSNKNMHCGVCACVHLCIMMKKMKTI